MVGLRSKTITHSRYSLNGSSGSVNGDLQFLWGYANFNPLQNQYPWTNRQKIRHSWLHPWGDPVYQIWYKCTHWGLLGKWVKYNKKLFFIYTFFLRHAHRSDPWMNFYTRDSSKDVKSRKDVPFGGLNNVPINFGGKLPKNSNFGGVNRTFKPERQKISNPYNLKTTDPIMTKFLQGVRTASVPSWVVPWLPHQIQDGGGRHL